MTKSAAPRINPPVAYSKKKIADTPKKAAAFTNP
jgi:hypothetical protein